MMMLVGSKLTRITRFIQKTQTENLTFTFTVKKVSDEWVSSGKVLYELHLMSEDNC